MMHEIKNEYSNNLKGLSVYEKSLNFVKEIHWFFSEPYDIVLCENIRKTACNISTNLAESHATKYYGKEFSHLNEAIGSINRICAFLELAYLRGFLPFEVFRQLTYQAVELLRMTIGLVKKNRKSNKATEGGNISVDEFGKSLLYKRSIDLMQSIYLLVDDVELKISDKDWKSAYEIAIEVPSLIASGIGQLNMKIRIRNFNKVKDKLKDLEKLLGQFKNLPFNLIDYLNDIEDLRVQVMKMLNAYFGSLKSSNVVEQIQYI
jgi:four helix bundle protein